MKSFQNIVKTLPDGSIITIPLAVLQGAGSGPALGIVAAVHGCEYCGMDQDAQDLHEDEEPCSCPPGYRPSGVPDDAEWDQLRQVWR